MPFFDTLANWSGPVKQIVGIAAAVAAAICLAVAVFKLIRGDVKGCMMFCLYAAIAGLIGVAGYYIVTSLGNSQGGWMKGKIS